MQQSGQLTIMKGRLRRIEAVNGGFDIEYSADGLHSHVQADAVINCIGSESNFEQIDSPFVKSLFAGGHVRNDGLSLGLNTEPDGTIIGRDEAPSHVLKTLGTAL